MVVKQQLIRATSFLLASLFVMANTNAAEVTDKTEDKSALETAGKTIDETSAATVEESPIELKENVTESLGTHSFSGEFSLQGRYFKGEGAHLDQQKSGGVSLSLQPEYKYLWDNDHKKITFTPFYRWDQQDKERTHADIRQLDIVSSQGDWEFQAGIGKVYWGVAESQHLVDIINQSDAVEGIDGEDKLGQPLFRVSRLTDNGALDLFVLPYFRERTFAGKKGRFRTPLVVDTAKTSYESGQKEKHIDYAIRFTETVDEFDIGVHVFDGTSRDPIFSPIANPNTTTANAPPVGLQAHYPLITQMGFDLQYTGESTIWKLEAINRSFNKPIHKDYSALVGGFEHTLPAFENGSEVGLLAEYHKDSRGEAVGVPFQNDLFIGARYALNDEAGTDVLAGAFVDLDNATKSIRAEASRRIGKGFKLNIEGQAFVDVDKTDPLSAFAKDDFLQIELQKFF